MKYIKTRRNFVLSIAFVYIFLLAYNTIIFENLIIQADYIWQVYTSGRLDTYARKDLFYFNFSLLENRKTRPKVIYVKRPFFGGDIEDQFACPGCVLTHDSSVTATADALVFECDEIRKADLLLYLRSPWQRYVWRCEEPPALIRFSYQRRLTELEGVFNWTMTYRSDSNISTTFVIPYASVNKTVNEIIAEKDSHKLVAWTVSNCHEKRRMKYAKELAEYVQVDYYGMCFGEREGHLNLSKYKFYLAFENSHCKEYISEKFWFTALSNFAVPVVMGTTRSDYERVAPPNSFIHVDDFKSPKELATYLLKLDNEYI